ncbi:MAG TPA: M1 family metallopeptidase [Gemmatimonadaceae bacterium]|nr:M1 family metallopeptidase [Gemmatimonadaceae bacterium]
MRTLPAALLVLAPLTTAAAQDSVRFTHADSLRGANGPARAWWDVVFYDLHVAVRPADSTIRGHNGITYRVLQPGATELQVDLMEPLAVDSIVQDGRALAYRRDGDAFFVTLAAPQPAGAEKTVTVHYHGRPIVAKRAPWDGGIVWATDSLGRPWIATANEGIGASVWWPNKDIRSDEPDSQRVAITVPDGLIDVSNGRLRRTTPHDDGTTTYEWFVTDPINNYDVAINAAHYAHFDDVYQGEGGRLTLDYWPLAYHVDTARAQFAQVRPMLRCFERWFGPFPWYADGYKLVETPHLGMEHQSAVAYGNEYKNGYRGRDRSGTGWGETWDFIIVHESAHEWWGNSVTGEDPADMWIHEGFANYAEALYVECRSGKKAGAQYTIGSRRNIRNDAPIIPARGVDQEGSGDMYDKAGNMLHMIRQIIDDDARFRGILRGLQATFRHQTVSSAEVEAYISEHAGVDLSKVFEQYLTTTRIPVLEWRTGADGIDYRWREVVPGFAMPLRVTLAGAPYRWIRPTERWQTLHATLPPGGALLPDPEFYVWSREVGAVAAASDRSGGAGGQAQRN